MYLCVKYLARQPCKETLFPSPPFIFANREVSPSPPPPRPQAETQGPNHKVMVFFPTRFMAQFYADLFTQMENRASREGRCTPSTWGGKPIGFSQDAHCEKKWGDTKKKIRERGNQFFEGCTATQTDTHTSQPGSRFHVPPSHFHLHIQVTRGSRIFV